MNVCGLCKKTKKLMISHIIPSFATRWLKKTGVTGYIRGLKSPNLRVQDSAKEKLLCGDCEALFSRLETQFARDIFYPYVNKELNDEYVAAAKIKYFEYGDYLLKFIISINWRILSKDIKSDSVKRSGIDRAKLCKSILKNWSDFLLGKSKTLEATTSYVMFLQNLASAHGVFPGEIPRNVNFYLLRANDGTILESKVACGVYTKLGPIICYSAISPRIAIGMNDMRIRNSGQLKTAQQFKNAPLNQYFFITRPKQLLSLTKISPFQERAIKEQYLKNQHKWERSASKIAFEADLILQNKLHAI